MELGGEGFLKRSNRRLYSLLYELVNPGSITGLPVSSFINEIMKPSQFSKHLCGALCSIFSTPRSSSSVSLECSTWKGLTHS